MINAHIDMVFSSEPPHDEYFQVLYPESEHVLVDPERSRFPISTTIIRDNGVHAHWDMIPSEVRREYVKKVFILGTESTETSTPTRNLATATANHVEEHGREIYENMCRWLTLPEDYARIDIGHAHQVNLATDTANRVLFADTPGERHQELPHRLREPLSTFPSPTTITTNQDYNPWLFLQPNFAWVDDGSRILGNDHTRSRTTRRMEDMMTRSGINHVTINGNYHQRPTTAMNEIDALPARTLTTLTITTRVPQISGGTQSLIVTPPVLYHHRYRTRHLAPGNVPLAPPVLYHHRYRTRHLAPGNVPLAPKDTTITNSDR